MLMQPLENEIEPQYGWTENTAKIKNNNDYK